MLRYGMQHLCQQVQTFESKLVETRQQVQDLAGRIQLAERQVYDVQHQIEHADAWPRSNETAIAAVRDQDPTIDHLWQELHRLAQKEDRLRHEKLIAAQLELTLYEALLQLEAQTGLGECFEVR